MVEWVKGTRTKEIKYIQLATKTAAVVLQWNVRFVSSSRKSVEGWGFMVVMGILIKCGVRVYGGNGIGTLISSIRSLVGILLWILSIFQLQSLCIIWDICSDLTSRNLLESGIFMFNDEEKGWPWTERVVSSEYACTYYLGLSCHPRTGKACIFWRNIKIVIDIE